MDADGASNAGPNFGTTPAEPNTRFTSPLAINTASRRGDLFSRSRPKDFAARSEPVSDSKVTAANSTKIPRPAHPNSLSYSSAYKRAEEEDAAQGSPSPAPRSWRDRRDSADKRTAKTSIPVASDAQYHRAGPGRKSLGATNGDIHGDPDAPSQHSDRSDSSFDGKLREYARDHASLEGPGRHSNGWVSKSRLGTKIVDAGRELLARQSSRGSFDPSSSPRAARPTGANSPSLLRRLSGRRRESSAAAAARESLDRSLLGKTAHKEHAQLSIEPDFHTPDKSFAWQTDVDFTAGDLQVSTSPPVALERRNTKIEELRAREEAEVNRQFAENPEGEPGNLRIGSFHRTEVAAIPKSSDNRLEPAVSAHGIQQADPEDDDGIPNRRPSSRTSMRTDHIGSRERTRRALATARLDELREKNIKISRSPSPDVAQKPSREPTRAFSPLRDRLRRGGNGATEQVGGGQNATTLAIRAPHHSPNHAIDRGHALGQVGSEESRPIDPPTNGGPVDVLRRLAIVTSGSPAPETQRIADNQAPESRDRDLAERGRQRRLVGGAKGDARPTVGFAQLTRSSSAESKVAKRASLVHSDSDPTERIEGEMSLFAPQENQSERGSLRAPSPGPEGQVVDETPKPIKPDPLTQPTPRVTGAFVETPATVKVEKLDGSAAAPVAEPKDANPPGTDLGHSNMESSRYSKPALAEFRNENQEKRTQSSRGGRGRASSLSARRRARSFSRGRAPLINSAKPPTVRDDLLEIQRVNQIDDSTLDDIADLLILHEPAGAALASRRVKIEPENKSKPGVETKLEEYDQLSRSLETGLLAIRTAKQGIERLEDKVAHANLKDDSQQTNSGGGVKGEPPACPTCHGSHPPAAGTTVVYLQFPLPRLWHREPRFRFTLLGLSLFLFSLCYLAESWMCSRYCKPEYCYLGTPCDWSSDDPVWGYAVPVKLDQWVTGGQVRELVRRVRPDVADWMADMWDAAAGTDIAAVDTSQYSWEQKRQHRRRLAKKGLGKPFVERPEDSAIFSGWKSAREARERAQTAQAMGYEVDDDETIAVDERL
ncbi:hypothetical protein C8A05DRAFT_29945 [Staphylotrichum tortipilum]|uniref:Uncharacterized protein n=1 Tax=Staphylotrichum tortipilum TaxID=2831512 RepID=A0AAN6MSD0_9PEZI|nr:hypothetical protein C8A05DRAFT_29945 [Staphylotrichum longicolle]